MATIPPIQSPPDPLQGKVEASRQAWNRLGMAFRSITPRALGRALLVLTALAALAWLAVASWPALLPFIMGAVLAYILLPLVDALDWIMPRFVAALLGMLLGLGAIVGLLWVIIPPVIQQITILLQQIPPDTTLKDVGLQLIALLQSLPTPIRVALANAIMSATERLGTNINSIAPSLLNVATIMRFLNAIGFILGLVVLPTWLLTVLKDKPKARRTLGSLLPQSMQPDFWAILKIFDRSFGLFFRGQVLVGLLVGIVTYVGLKFLVRVGVPDSPYLVLFAVLAGLFQLIPEVGPLINIVLIVLVAYRIDPQLALYIFLLYLGIQLLIGNLIKGRIEESIIDVHPALLVLFMVALSQLGIFWLFFAAPVAGLSRDLYRYAYGRLSEPPRPAGLLPGASTPVSASGKTPVQTRRRVPSIYQRSQNRPNKQ